MRTAGTKSTRNPIFQYRIGFRLISEKILVKTVIANFGRSIQTYKTSKQQFKKSDYGARKKN